MTTTNHRNSRRTAGERWRAGDSIWRVAAVSTGTTQFFAGTTTTPIPPSGCGRSTGARMY